MVILFLPYNVPSLKNSKIKTSRGVFHSKTVKQYLNKLGIQSYSTRDKKVKGYVNKPNLFKQLEQPFKNYTNENDYPIKIGFHFVRDKKHKFDFHNAVQIIADLLVAHDFIEDDNMDFFIPIPFKKNSKWYSYDKENPGVFLKLY